MLAGFVRDQFQGLIFVKSSAAGANCRYGQRTNRFAPGNTQRRRYRFANRRFARSPKQVDSGDMDDRFIG
jgi:hypothetical protein